MRNLLLLLLSATCGLILGSCSRADLTEVNPINPNKIHFSTTTTRATINDLETIKVGFMIYAVSGASSTWYSHINGTIYKFTEPNWVWDGTTPDWPDREDGYPMKFYAYFPATANGFTVGATAPALTGAIIIEQMAINQTDFLVAKTETDTKPTGGKLTMIFNHITSKVNFGVIAGKNVNASVSQVGFMNVINKGTFNYVTGLWNATVAVELGSYDYFKNAIEFIAPTGIDGTTSVPFYTGTNTNLMLRPQAETASWDGVATEDGDTGEATAIVGSYIAMSYRVKLLNANSIGFDLRASCAIETTYTTDAEFNKYKKTNGSYNGALYVKVGFPLGTALTWVMGKGYNYNIKLGTFDGTGGYYLSQYYWDKDGINTKIPVERDPEIGDKVSGGEINFDVEIGVWEDTADTIIK